MNRSFRALLLLALSSTAGFAQANREAPGAIHDALAIQAGRKEHVTSRGKRAFYERRWDLSGLPPYQPSATVSGTIRMWGLNYVADGNLAAYWEAAFRKTQPGVSFEYHLHTTLQAVAGLVTGAADLGPSRKITWDELESFHRRFNRDPVEIEMATGSYDVPGWNNALGIFVNRSNPIRGITYRQLDGIFGAARTGGFRGNDWHPEAARAETEDLRSWGELGLTGAWADRPIHVYGLALKAHQQLILEQRVFKGGDKWTERLREYENYVTPDGQFHIAAAELMKDLGKDPDGIGYSGVQNANTDTKCLPLSESDGGPFVPLTLETVRDRSYPLADRVYMYFDRDPARPVDPKVREYLLFILSRDGQEEVQRDGKYVPLTAEVVRLQREKLR